MMDNMREWTQGDPNPTKTLQYIVPKKKKKKTLLIFGNSKYIGGRFWIDF